MRVFLAGVSDYAKELYSPFISVVLSAFLFIVNFLFDIIILEKVQGLPIFFPLLFCSFGLIFASKAFQLERSLMDFGAIIVNSVLFLFPFIYMMGGTLIFGV